MTSGFEDWQVPVNVVGQLLTELINRPKYGVPTTLFYGDTVSPHTMQNMGLISGKGQIYGGFVSWHSTGECKETGILLYLDGVLTANYSPLTLYNLSILRNGSFFIFLLHYDNTYKLFTIGFSFPISFETSVQVFIDTYDDQDHEVTMRLNYAVV